MSGQILEPGGSEATVSSYREFPPRPELAHAVLCTWTQIVGHGPRDYPQRVLPDGCVDLVWIPPARQAAVGPQTRSFVASLPRGALVTGIRFRPGWAAYALGVDASELLDREVPLTDLWGRSGALLEERLAELRTPEARRAGVEQAILARPEGPSDAIARAAVAWLARHPALPVERLAAELELSTRQLHRRFRAAVGYGPKTFQRIARFQRLLSLGKQAPHAGLTRLALAAGYADQAHMTREVGSLAGRTPAVMLGRVGSTLSMSDLFEPEPALTDTIPARR